MSLSSLTPVRTYTLKYGTLPDFSKLYFMDLLLVLNLDCWCSLGYNGKSHAREGVEIRDSKSKEVIAFIIFKARLGLVLTDFGRIT